MTTDIKWLSIPLPDDVARAKAAGYWEDCRAAILTHLADRPPKPMVRRLELELERLPFFIPEEYPYSDEEALALLGETFADFQPQELEELVNSRAADWMYREGQRRFHRRFIENIIATRPDYDARQKHPTPESQGDRAGQARIMEHIGIMEERGSRTARLTVRQTFRLKPEAVRPGEPLTVYLPVPRPCAHQRDIEILEVSHPHLAVLAPEQHPQRTVCFPNAPAGDAFSVTYRYVNQMNYVNPDFNLAQRDVPPELGGFLHPQAPHILFTPLMEALSAQIQGEEKNPLKKARNAYDFVTKQIKYSYMPEYAVLDTICDYAAKNRKGDCGVQAILFITLCRLAGVPARWQSGFAADPDHVGCHDWAEFYVAPYGWLFADCSYGGSAFRAGDERKWNFYFGNLDVFRMVANSELQSQFTPEKKFFRADPTDNQRGEAEYADGGILPFHFLHREEMVAFEELD